MPRILDASGWTGVDIRPIDVPCGIAETDLLDYVTRLGPVGLALRDVDEPTRARTAEAVRAAFDPYVENDAARFTAACWARERAGLSARSRGMVASAAPAPRGVPPRLARDQCL